MSGGVLSCHRLGEGWHRVVVWHYMCIANPTLDSVCSYM